MLRFLCLSFLYILGYANASEMIPEERVYLQGIDEKASDIAMENSIVNFETVARDAEKSNREGIIPKEDTENLYTEMSVHLDDILELMNNPNYAYVFLKAKGIDRIIAPSIMVSSEELRKQFLILLRVLFEVAPTTTNALIPIHLVDRLLDIFENDNNLALKARTLDVLYLWLPENPNVQARVMKLKGLEPFYEQVAKLDIKVIHTLLELFNKILNEHLKARNHDKMQKNKADSDKLILYQRIGLLERMSTPTVCNGLLNIFEATWSYNTDNELMGVVFQLIKNVKPFCLKNYTGKYKAVELFNTLLKFVNDPKKRESLIENDFNVTDIQLVLEDYADKIKFSAARDEF